VPLKNTHIFINHSKITQGYLTVIGCLIVGCILSTLQITPPSNFMYLFSLILAIHRGPTIIIFLHPQQNRTLPQCRSIVVPALPLHLHYIHSHSRKYQLISYIDSPKTSVFTKVCASRTLRRLNPCSIEPRLYDPMPIPKHSASHSTMS